MNEEIIYKCLQCSKIFNAKRCYEIDFSLMPEWLSVRMVGLQIIHKCDGKTIGIADMIGIKNYVFKKC